MVFKLDTILAKFTNYFSTVSPFVCVFSMLVLMLILSETITMQLLCRLYLQTFLLLSSYTTIAHFFLFLLLNYLYRLLRLITVSLTISVSLSAVYMTNLTATTTWSSCHCSYINCLSLGNFNSHSPLWVVLLPMGMAVLLKTSFPLSSSLCCLMAL